MLMESKPTVSAYRAPNNSPALQRAVTRRRQGQLSIGGIGPHRPTHIIRLPHYQHRPLHRSRNQRVRSGTAYRPTKQIVRRFHVHADENCSVSD
jgi:hypothetical protein